MDFSISNLLFQDSMRLFQVEGFGSSGKKKKEKKSNN